VRIFLGILILVSLAGALDSYGRTPVVLLIPLLGMVCWVLASRQRATERRMHELEARLRKTLSVLETHFAREGAAPAVPQSPQAAGAQVPAPEEAPSTDFVFSPQESETDVIDDDTAAADAAALLIPPASRPQPHAAAPSAGTAELSRPAPGWADDALQRAWEWLVGGNPVVKAGIVVLFFGVSFLLKYASDHSLVPVELRMAGAGLLGIALLALGWRLRRRNPVYALLVQGGGVGVLYLTIFAAARFLGMLPPWWALVLMTGVVVFSGILAVLQNAMSLALFGAAGGFLAPILLSTGQGSHVHLFAYYALLNLGVVGIAVYRTWRPLNLLGFACTFGIGAAWGAGYYTPEYFATTEPFLILFFVMYGLVSILFARASKENPRLDSALVFGLPLAAFALQMELVRNMDMGGAYSCLGLAAWYILPQRHIRALSDSRGGHGGLRLLSEAHLALGIIFISLAVPMALDATWTSSTWALEGAGMVWLGMRQNRLVTRGFGVLLQIGAAGALMFSAQGAVTTMSDGQFLAAVFLGLGGLASGWCWWAYPEVRTEHEETLDLVAGIWGALWWYAALFGRFGRAEQELLLAAVTGSLIAWGLLQRRVSWPMPGYLAQATAWIMLAIALDWRGHPLAGLGWLVWPAALTVLFAAMWTLEHEWKAASREWTHSAAGLLAAVLLAREVHWRAFDVLRVGSWAEASLALAGVLFLVAVSLAPLAWPLRRHHVAYLRSAVPPAAGLVLWWAAVSATSGDPSPLPYVPVLNPLDLVQALVLAALAVWAGAADRSRAFGSLGVRGGVSGFLAVAGFIWMNVVLARCVHFYAAVPYLPAPLFRSGVMQASCSVLWSVSALVAMLSGWRRSLRRVWLGGAGLLAAVVAKLFLVDLDGRGTVARIVSFLAVGLLMLVIGYFCPLPPKEDK